MSSSVLFDVTAPYGAAEAFLYDSLVAPAVGRLARMEARLDALPAGARVLEVGCGGGQLAVDLTARRPDLDYTGLDLSPRQVARAARRGRAGGGRRLRFIEGSALDLPFPPASFDVVLSVASLKHWPDRAGGLAECVRVLRSGGRLLVVEADRGCRLEDARGFVSLWLLPRALRPLALAYFRTYVAGQALDLDEARALLAALPLADTRVERIPGTPALELGGRKHP